MKCLLKTTEEAGFKLTDIDIPKPSSGELLVKVIKVGLCGSDIQLYKWSEIAKSIASLPFIPGHECVGEIVDVGEGCPPEYTIGRRVCCENHFFCGKCYQCLNNQRNICQHLDQYGHGKGTMHGGLSEYSIIPARYAYLLKTDIPSDIAVMLEAFGVAHQGVEKLLPENDTVLIQGCGPIGLYSVGLCNYFGAKKIIATDIVDSRLELAKKLGAHIVVDGKSQNLKETVLHETDNDGVGRLLEASGAQPLVNDSFKLLRKGGTVVCIGIPKVNFDQENPGNSCHCNLQNLVNLSHVTK